ncbi:hypothetical protein E4U56_000310 [Claviceps arundinis]|uniref:DUF6570 domain-containing protein n=1 Tax=Claviceps arundinis TaxID=1623583 RepID=A0A9P7MTX6_9HYPO|nr:hypothetical protein E4U56_000310 [Claviceps arundinis]
MLGLTTAMKTGHRTYAHELDPGEPPEHLEPLTPLEEWLIARVQTHMQVMTYRSAQYKYHSHIISFPKNVPTMHHRGQLEILILRPRNQTDQPNMINQFRTQLRVNRSAHPAPPARAATRGAGCGID